ncbi:hypothetical protein N9A44_00455 [Gammaproteobacteria bacterium]|nr:hypothetical protein [Gammaproteobacteria bacterium]
MKYKVILLSFIFIGLSGCVNLEVSEKNNSVDEVLHKKNNLYEEYKITGVIKFKQKENNISSRFNYKKDKDSETIEFLDFFNNIIIAFEVTPGIIKIKNAKKNINSKSLKEIINRPIFKNIIVNFSGILSGDIKDKDSIVDYKNGLHEKIKTREYEIDYKSYNKMFLPTHLEINFLKIFFSIKILHWEIQE